MHQAFEHCHVHRDAPRPSDSLASMCWPIINQQRPLTVLEKAGLAKCPPRADVSWPVSEPWRRNLNEPRCGGQGRCQGDPQRCNSKYRYGVDDVGQCPTQQTCKKAYCCAPCPPECVQPCPNPPGCNRLTTRCFDWPIPKNEKCAPVNTNMDFRPPRADLNDQTVQPERCPTCKRIVVDMECGPLGYNY
ncbi:uncharacterized protein LOC131933195 [Physella acuta]|uniref:uncharacterized protein LOC131933195 n=1 Tax=Physella acuta TaxID=109671 RepID=UPI0027DEA497|nr:uncharacterized protein LOC131933195 [Physella acuta]